MSGRVSVIVCWVIISAIAIWIPLRGALREMERPLPATIPSTLPVTQAVEPDIIGIQTEVAGKCVVGASQEDKSSAPVLLGQLHQLAKNPAEKLAAGVVSVEINGLPDGLRSLDASGSPDAPEFNALYQHQRPLPNDVAERYGFFAKLAAVKSLPNDDPRRIAVMTEARRVAGLLSMFSLLLVLLALLGFVLLVIGVVLAALGKMHMVVRRPQAPAHVYVEAFTLWIVTYIGGSVAAGLLLSEAGLLVSVGLLVVAFSVFMLWPRVRGVRWAVQREDWGLTFSRPLENVFCGIIGYLAGLPILAVGLIITVLLMRVTNVVVTHPAAQQISQIPVAIFLLASIFAPLTEETLFRGALVSHLRGRLGPVWSAIISAIVFASIHPQGWAGIPVIASIGFVLAMIRQWRGSLLASMTAHALNNGVVLLAALAMR